MMATLKAMWHGESVSNRDGLRAFVAVWGAVSLPVVLTICWASHIWWLVLLLPPYLGVFYLAMVAVHRRLGEWP